MKPERSAEKLPPVLVYAAALTCGVLAAVAMEIHLGRAGFSLIPLWEALFSPRVLDLRTTGPWWAIAGVAFLVSGLTAAALSRVSLPFRRLRLARWVAGSALVLLLAHVGHGSVGLPHVDIGANTAVSLAALFLAGMLALCGAYFTVQR
jgi:hypothetical protein